MFEQYEVVVVEGVKTKRWEEGFSKVCSRETIRDSFEKGIPVSEAIELAFEDTFYTHGYKASRT